VGFWVAAKKIKISKTATFDKKQFFFLQ